MRAFQPMLIFYFSLILGFFSKQIFFGWKTNFTLKKHCLQVFHKKRSQSNKFSIDLGKKCNKLRSKSSHWVRNERRPKWALLLWSWLLLLHIILTLGDLLSSWGCLLKSKSKSLPEPSFLFIFFSFVWGWKKKTGWKKRKEKGGGWCGH